MDKINYIPNLKNFFIKGYKKPNSKIKIYPANKLPPTKICPYLLHTLIPYIFTLSNKGIFPWMIAKDSNSVFIQCPKGDVTCKLTRKNINNKLIFSVNVKSIKGHCLFNHFKNQKINLPNYGDYGEGYLTFNMMFPWIVYGTLSKKNFCLALKNPLADNKIFYLQHGKNNFKNIAVCSPPKKIKLKFSGCKRKICRYHKFSTCNNFKLETLCPPGLCPDLFYRAYPWCLMKLYGDKLKIEKDKNPMIIHCPNPKINVKLAVTKIPTKSAKLRIKIMDILRKLGKNMDIPLYKISMKIVQDSKDCPRNHRKEQSFNFNSGLGFDRSLCPAAFNNVYLFLHSILRGVSLPKPLRIQCPDDAVKNTYDLFWNDKK